MCSCLSQNAYLVHLSVYVQEVPRIWPCFFLSNNSALLLNHYQPAPYPCHLAIANATGVGLYILGKFHASKQSQGDRYCGAVHRTALASGLIKEQSGPSRHFCLAPFLYPSSRGRVTWRLGLLWQQYSAVYPDVAPPWPTCFVGSQGKVWIFSDRPPKSPAFDPRSTSRARRVPYFLTFLSLTLRVLRI
eukprot:g59742.t1